MENETRYSIGTITKEMQAKLDKKVNVEVSGDTGFAIRQLAERQGFFISRGPGAGEIGSIKGLLDAMAECYWENPKAAEVALHLFFVKFHEKNAKGVGKDEEDA